MTSLQNQIIKYGKKHIGSAKNFFFPLERKWLVCDSHLCLGIKLCWMLPLPFLERCNAKIFGFVSKWLLFFALEMKH